MSLPELRIMNILQKLMNDYDLWFFYKHKWHFCKNVRVLEYDFYCVLIHNNRLIQFVVEYDGGHHFQTKDLDRFKTQNRRDIIKQYYLRRMGIHLLRVNERAKNMEICVYMFIKKLIDADYYINLVGMAPGSYVFHDKKQHEGLKCFAEFYASAKAHIEDCDMFSLVVRDVTVFDSLRMTGLGTFKNNTYTNIVGL
jgi:hypothetical protein